MPVPYTFGTATASIPLSQLDSNFATAITIGNTAVQLGNTVTTLNNMTLANVTISSGNVTITNVTVTTANATTANVGTLVVTSNATVGGNISVTGNVSMNVATITTSNVTTENVSSLIVTGNQTFVGTGNRITGDFSNATTASRIAFQSSTTNTNTALMVLPSGTATISGADLFNNSDPTNAAYASIQSRSTEVRLQSAITGTGTYLPMTFYTGGSERMRVDTSGNVGIGTSSPSTYGKFAVAGQSSLGVDQADYVSVLGASGTARVETSGSSANSNLAFSTKGTGAIYFWRGGYGTTISAIIDGSGNVGIGTSSPSAKLHVFGTEVRVQQNACYYSLFDTAGTRYGYIQGGSGYLDIVSEAGSANTIRFTTNSSERMRVDSSGNLLVGKTTTDNATVGVSWSPTGAGTSVYAGGAGDGPQIQVVNTTASGTAPNGFRYLSFRLGATATEIGTITKASATTVAYNTSSDYRLKYDIAPMTGALEKVKQLKPCTYKWHEDDSDGEGFIAHELAEVCPFAVTGEKDAVNEDGSIKPQGIDTSFLVATLTAAIQEQQALITQLQADIATLKGQK